jgi:translocation and assembly module TamB
MPFQRHPPGRQEKKAPKRFTRTKFLQPFVILVAITVLLPVALLILLHVPSVQNLVIKEAIKQIEKTSSVQVHLEAFRWWPFGHLWLNSLRVEQSGEELVHCEQVDMKYRVSLNHPFLTVTDIVLKKPVVKLAKNADGRWKLAESKSTGKEKGDNFILSLWKHVPLAAVRVESGSVVVRQQGQPDPLLSLHDLTGNLAVLLESASGAPGPKLQINQLEGRMERPEVGGFRVSGVAQWQEGRMLLNEWKVDVDDGTHVRVHGSYDWKPDLGVDLDIQLEPLCLACIPALRDRFYGMESLSGSIQATRRNEGWTFKHQINTAAVSLDGTATLSTQPDTPRKIDWNTTFKDLRVPLREGIGDGLFNGSLQATLEGERPESMHGQFECRLGPSSIAKEAIDQGKIRAVFAKGRLTLQSVDVRSPLGSLLASAFMELDGFWDAEHRGRGEVKLEVKGTNLGRLFSAQFPHQSVDLQANLQGEYGPGQITSPSKWKTTADVQLNAPGLVTAKSSARYENESLDLNYVLDVRALQVLAHLVPNWNEVHGQLESQGRVQGKWHDLFWDGKGVLKKFQHAGLQCDNCVITGRGELQGKGGKRQLTINASGLTVGDISTRSARLELEQKESGISFQVSGEKIGSHGSLQLAGTVQDAWTLPGKLILQNGRLGWKDQFCSLDGQLEFNRDAITVQSLKLHQDSQEVKVVGQLAWDRESRLQMNWDRIPVEKLSASLGQGTPVSGFSSGNLQLGGSLEQPKLAAEIKITNGKLHSGQTFESQFKGSFAGKQLNVTGTVQSSILDAPLTIAFLMPLQISLKPLQWTQLRDQPVSGSLHMAGLNTESLLPYIPLVEKIAGRVEGSAKLSGTLAQPELSASGSWKDGILKLQPWPYAAQNIQLEWRADSQRFTVNSATMELLGGRASVTGEIKHSLGIPREINLEAQAQGIDIPEIYGITGRGSGKFQLTRANQGPKLTGTFNFSQAEMNLGEFETGLARNIEVIGETGDKPVMDVGTPSRHGSQVVDRAEMDLELRTPPSGTWVRGKGLDAEVNGTVRLVKDAAAPLKVFGSLQSIRGTYTFQGHRIPIVEGELAFLGVTEPIPTLSVLGQKDIQGVTIQMRVTGPISEPKLLLSSLPAMNQVDILSYFLFGRPATQLTSKENAGLQQNAAVFFGSEASREFKKLLGNSPFAPDILQLSNSEKGGGVVEIGKYLTPDFYVTYEKGLSSEQGDQIQIEYRLNRHLSIQSQFGLNQQRSVQSQSTDRDQSGIDVFWRYDFGD